MVYELTPVLALMSSWGDHTAAKRKSCTTHEQGHPIHQVRRSSHLLAQSGDVPGSFDDALSSVMMLVQFIAEGFEHRHEWRHVC